eukprot:5388401-Prymnesium_polylepis.1
MGRQRTPQDARKPGGECAPRGKSALLHLQCPRWGNLWGERHTAFTGRAVQQRTAQHVPTFDRGALERSEVRAAARQQRQHAFLHVRCLPTMGRSCVGETRCAPRTRYRSSDVCDYD